MSSLFSNYSDTSVTQVSTAPRSAVNLQITEAVNMAVPHPALFAKVFDSKWIPIN